MPSRFFTIRLLSVLLSLAGADQVAVAADNPFVGAWELSISGSGAGWLGIKESGDHLEASMMWIAGSVEPVASAKIEDGKLVVTREHFVEQKKPDGSKVKKKITQTITGTFGDKLILTSVTPHENDQGVERVELTGKRSPPMPLAPDLSKVKFGAPIHLFNGKDLTGWRLTDPKAVNGWSAKEGLLVNTAAQEEGKPHKQFGNLRTDREFEDFNLTLQVKVSEKQNSGIYLRGIYEVQVEECYGQPPTTHNMGCIYSRIQPTKNTSKPGGEWQSFDITLVDRHVTVVLNGTKIIDNQPVEGCTGGALWSDVSRPGPIYLQGDHTSVEYRDIDLRPVLK